MKFSEELRAHATPEWRQKYIQYDHMKGMLYKALEMVPSTEVVEEEAVRIYFTSFELAFFTFATEELQKINLFYSEKLAEAVQKFSFLKHEVERASLELLDEG